MPISVTCQCGARLEIDEKFLGKEVPCPDCQRPLPTSVAPKPPPLDLPTHRKKSGLAVLSLALALVGAFLPVLSLGAIALGVVALRRIANNPSKLEGVRFARAGIIVGGIGIFLTIVAIISPYVFGVDQLLREFMYAGRLEWTSGPRIRIPEKIDIKRLDGWARWTGTNLRTNENSDILILVNPTDDAFLSCLSLLDVKEDDADEKRKRVIEHLSKSEVVSLMGRLRGAPLNREAVVLKKEAVANGTKEEVQLDLYVGGHLRRFLVQYPLDVKANMPIFVAASRPHRFDRLQKDFHEMFDSIQFK